MEAQLSVLQVSWIRLQNLHILTVDRYKYSTDQRVSVQHDEAAHEWLLRIHSVERKDSGMYECQVSTTPLLSFIVSLEVVDALPHSTSFPPLGDAAAPVTTTPLPRAQVPSATILSAPEIHVHRGSLINLTCVVEHSEERGPLFVVWYHGNKVVDYEAMGGSVEVKHSGHTTVSSLLVQRAEQSDSGSYTCTPSSGEHAHATLHVLDGEHPGALQTNGASRNGIVGSGMSFVDNLAGPVLFRLLLLLLLLLLSLGPC